MKHGFTKAERLLKRSEFDRVFAERRAFRDTKLALHVAPNELDFARLGIVVTKKSGNAVVRNRIKRLIREAFRLNKELLGGGLDIVVLPRRGLEQLNLAEVESSLKLLMAQARERVGHTRPD